MNFSDFWIHGLMPVQFLLILVVAFGLLVFGNFLLKRFGKGIPVFGQAFVIWLTAFFILKYLIHPPIPSSLLYTYLGLVTLVIYLLVSSTERGWTEFKRPLLTTLRGNSLKTRVVRSAVFTFLPVFAFIATFQLTNPVYEEPVELRVSHPAPPAYITIHGKKYNLQNARNPFRTDGPPLYPDTGMDP